MSSDPINNVTIQRQDRIAIISFDRGLAANPLSLSLMRELTDAARQFEDDHQISAIILTGRKDNFSMGFDLKDPELQEVDAATLAERRLALATGKRLCQAWEDLPQLTISAIEGWCVGGGVALSVATDLRVVSAESTLYVPEVERGLNMSWGSVPRIVNLVGPARAKRLIMLAEQLSAQQAVDWGLADEIARSGSATDAALKMAQKAAAMPPVALRMCKRDINAYANALAAVSSHSDADGFTLAQASADAEEGINAFLGKRNPEFKGD
ncbi:MAG: enoyl-CoA hydratase/isomerase family protein [Rhizobiaceae bacterium]